MIKTEIMTQMVEMMMKRDKRKFLVSKASYPFAPNRFFEVDNLSVDYLKLQSFVVSIYRLLPFSQCGDDESLNNSRYLRLVSHDASDTSYLNNFLFQIPEEGDGGNIGDRVKIAGEAIGSGDKIEFSEELKELLPAEAGK
ncbi:hypothetical protein Tco_0559851 [Tanacetum coccineum]